MPLTIYYDDEVRETTEEDEGGILLALRDNASYLPRFTSLDEPFPILGRMIEARIEGDTSLVLPEPFQASHLRHRCPLVLYPRRHGGSL